MLLPPNTQLEIVGVFDRGTPNSERIQIRAAETVQLTGHGLIYGLVNFVNSIAYISPFDDAFFWFGTRTVAAGEHIFVYTGAGEPRKTTIAGTNIVAHVMHWGRPKTMFARSDLSVGLVQFGAVLIAAPPQDVLQLPPSTPIKNITPPKFSNR